MTVLDPQAFDASTLADSEGLTVALRMLESCLEGPDISLDLILQDLCSVPNLFEFIVSGEFFIFIVHTLLIFEPGQPCQSVKAWFTKSWMPTQPIRGLSRLHLQLVFKGFHLSFLLYLLISFPLTLSVTSDSTKFI